MEQASTDAGADYDEVPYLSLPIAYTHPSRLAALGALHGMTPPPLQEPVSVLELGCASGGNLLPMAARLKHAQFVGVDISAHQIAAAQQRARYHRLDNVTFLAADAGKVSLPTGGFGYIICHGVYSWVPLATQRSLLARVAASLSDGGIAAISYNVLPGWRLRSPVRDILGALTRPKGSARERIVHARETLNLVSTLAPASPYGDLLRAEAHLLRTMPDSYILGEFLAPHNTPILFGTFLEELHLAGLEYICEADLDAEILGALSAGGQQRIREEAQKDRLRAAQMLDHVSGRPFRRSLVRRHSANAPLQTPAPERLKGLHLSSQLTAIGSEGSAAIFQDRRGQRLAVDRPEVAAALARLSEACPGSVPVESLADQRNPAQIGDVLLYLVTSGRAVLSASPVSVGRDSDALPKVWSYARDQAALRLPGVTNLQHVTAPVTSAQRHVAALADGTRDRAALAQDFAATFKGTQTETSREDANQQVIEALAHLGACAVLERQD